MRHNRDPNEQGAPLFGCLLLIGVACLVLYIAAVIIHFIGPIWLFVIILGCIVFLMALVQ